MKSTNYDMIYKTINNDHIDGVIACGFLSKKPEIKRHYFYYYGGFLILSGKGVYIDEEGNRTIIQKGDFVQRRPGVIHTTTVEDGEPWREFYICFGKKLYKTLTSINFISDAPILHTVPGHETLTRCESLLNRFKNSNEKNYKRLLIEVQSFILFINELASNNISLDNMESLVEELYRQLSDNLDKKLDLKKLVGPLPGGYESIRKMFKNETGFSMHHYRVLKRINEAKRLLHNPSLSIKAISVDLGYKDQYAFSNQFKKYIGMSPGKFRNMNIGENV
ncbi:MAG: helix-turn-helix domain-containing protein [Spirochaetaceae bacterium]